MPVPTALEDDDLADLREVAVDAADGRSWAMGELLGLASAFLWSSRTSPEQRQPPARAVLEGMDWLVEQSQPIAEPLLRCIATLSRDVDIAMAVHRRVSDGSFTSPWSETSPDVSQMEVSEVHHRVDRTGDPHLAFVGLTMPRLVGPLTALAVVDRRCDSLVKWATVAALPTELLLEIDRVSNDVRPGDEAEVPTLLRSALAGPSDRRGEADPGMRPLLAWLAVAIAGAG